MRKALLLSAAVLVAASSAVCAAKTPKGSFLTSRVTTLEQLVQQVTDDAIVAARYARHFRTPRNEVVDYFQSSLRIGRLRSDFETPVYTISGRTDAVATKKVLPKGSYVFVAATGEPLLEASTGNPLLDHLPLSLPNSEQAGGGVTPAGVAAGPGGSGVVTTVLGQSAATVGGTAGTSSALEAASPVGPGPLAILSPAAAAEPVVEIVSSIPVGGDGGSFFGAAGLGKVLPLAAAIGGAAALAGGGGGPAPAHEPLVPEPASLAALAFGLSALGLARLRRR